MMEQRQPVEPDWPPVPIARAALAGCCPRCGQGRLFASPVAFARRCSGCGLDYSAFNVGDGPAAFLTLIIGALVLGLALVFHFRATPPLWLELILWPIVTIILVVASLRLAKGALIAAEYAHAAREGRVL